MALHWPALNNPDMLDEPHRAPETNDASLTSHGESPRGRKESALANWIAAHEVALRGGIWVVVGASIAIGTFMWTTGRLDVQTVGYAGAFAVNLAGSASMFIPVPGLAVICGASAGGADLNLVLLGLAGAIGATIEELSGYLAGYTSKVFVRRSKRYARISHWVDRNGFLPLFVLAAIPNPFFDLVGIAAGPLGTQSGVFCYSCWLERPSSSWHSCTPAESVLTGLSGSCDATAAPPGDRSGDGRWGCVIFR